MPVVVSAGDYPNVDIVKASITAAILVYAQESVTLGKVGPEWAPWIGNSMQIDVLLANRPAFRKLQRLVRDQEHAMAETGRARALAMGPTLDVDRPRPMNALQRLSATFPDRSSKERPMKQSISRWPIVVIDYAHGTSTAVVAGIQALLGWFAKLDHAEQSAWYDPGCKFTLLGMESEEVQHLSVYGGLRRSVGRVDGVPVAVAISPSDMIS